MLQIKTIAKRIDDAKEFDAEVNAAIAEGWVLVKREVLQPLAHPTNGISRRMLYAELGRETITEDERTCDNCKHHGLSSLAEPCASCTQEADKWEPVE